jgi:hypothetical protein
MGFVTHETCHDASLYMCGSFNRDAANMLVKVTSSRLEQR